MEVIYRINSKVSVNSIHSGECIELDGDIYLKLRQKAEIEGYSRFVELRSGEVVEINNKKAVYKLDARAQILVPGRL